MKTSPLRSAVLLALFAAGCARSPEDWQPVVMEPDAVPITELGRGLHMHADQTPKYWRLTGGGHEIRVYPGLAMAWMDGEFVQLDAPIDDAAGVPLIPFTLAERIRARVGADIPPETAPSLQGLAVVLDAGHGGRDTGARGARGTNEKTVVLDITTLAADLLRQSGCEVILTRDSDRFIELQDRAELANRRGADLFVSIHANAKNPDSRPINGLEVYYPTYAQRLEAAKGNPGAPAPTIILETVQKSLQLARAVHDTVIDQTWCCSNGIRQDRRGLAVLRHTHCPAVLVEVGYLSDIEEEAKLRDPEYRKRVAHAIADAIVDYFKTSSGTYASN